MDGGSDSSEKSEVSNCDPRELLKRLRKLEKDRSRGHRRHRHHGRRHRSRSRSRSRRRSRARSPSVEVLEDYDTAYNSSRGRSTSQVSNVEQDVRDQAEHKDNLSEDILILLGEPKSSAPTLGDPVHADIAVRWEGILKQGLDAEVRKELIAKYPPIANCLPSLAPKINPEVKGAATEAALRRDERLVSKQNQITACLSAVGKLLTTLLARTGGGDEDRPIIELAGDTGRMLADLHFSESESRRILVGASLNKKFQTAMGDTSPDEWLFGSDLGERLKTAKSLERSTLELKAAKCPKNQLNKDNLNFNRPSMARPPQKRPFPSGGRNYSQPRGSGQKQHSQPRNNNHQQFRRQQKGRSNRQQQGIGEIHYNPRRQQ